MKPDQYVKELPGLHSFEVKLGAGILPVVVTREFVETSNRHSVGTAAVPGNLSITELERAWKAVALVNEYLASKV
jgi:hypothetical protein